MPYDSTDDASAGGIEAKMLSAYRAAHPGSETPSKKVLSDFIARDFRAIMARLDIGIAESHAHLDRIFSTLATGPSSSLIMAFWDLPQQFWAIARKFDELLSLQKRTEKSVDAILERLHALELRVIQLEADRGQMITEAKAAAGVAASGVASMIVSDAITRITRLEVRLADQPPRPPSSALPELPA